MFIISILLFKIFPLLSGILMSIAILIALMEFVFYKQFLDPFFPKKKSTNTIGTFNPTQEARQTIIFSGHIDSPFQFNFIKWWGGFVYGIIMFSFIVTFILFFVISVVNAILFHLNLLLNNILLSLITDQAFSLLWIIMMIVGIPLGVLFFFFTTWTPTLGAGDNLSAVSVVMGVGKFLKEARESGDFFPKHTKVQIAAWGAEEIGLRGAKAYAKAHQKELKAENAIVINMEVIVTPTKFYLTTRDLNSTIKLSSEVINDLEQVFKDLNIEVGHIATPFGAGSSDSAAFAQKGIETTCIFGVDLGSSMKGYMQHYHTVRDTPDKVDPKALESVLKACIHYLKFKDKNLA
ncbi:MAG: M28 family metallopeptidase, partial [Candidatus Helarchaeota archaeon]